MIEAKAQGKHHVIAEEAPAEGGRDLLDALKASVRKSSKGKRKD
jgi:non-homologous end joining protein Ku